MTAKEIANKYGVEPAKLLALPNVTEEDFEAFKKGLIKELVDECTERAKEEYIKLMQGGLDNKEFTGLINNLEDGKE